MTAAAGPRRIQLRRTKGWRKPPGAVTVARPSRWGNPFRIGGPDGRTREQAVAAYREWAAAHLDIDRVRQELAGRDLACWCPLVDADGHCVPCHADVLLELANAR